MKAMTYLCALLIGMVSYSCHAMEQQQHLQNLATHLAQSSGNPKNKDLFVSLLGQLPQNQLQTIVDSNNITDLEKLLSRLVVSSERKLRSKVAYITTAALVLPGVVSGFGIILYMLAKSSCECY